VVSPNSDDQYAIKITGTGLKEAISRSSFLTLDQDLIVSSILVGEQVKLQIQHHRIRHHLSHLLEVMKSQ
jgi:hypothetical protein